MSATILNKKTRDGVIGASLFVPISARELYEVVLDVRSFPDWALGVRRVEVVEGPVGPGMVSEWEVSVLGLRRRISSTLIEAEASSFLRWTYEGPIRGWGECTINDRGGGALAEFKTELRPAEPILEKLTSSLPARTAAYNHLKRCLVQLGRAATENEGGVRVGPLAAA
jgi:ribosome-associated toxin RatA of RatAB toxin-antitoxin module